MYVTTVSHLNVHFDVYFDRAILDFLKTTLHPVDDELVHKLHQRISTDELHLVPVAAGRQYSAGRQHATGRERREGGEEEGRTK